MDFYLVSKIPPLCSRGLLPQMFSIEALVILSHYSSGGCFSSSLQSILLLFGKLLLFFFIRFLFAVVKTEKYYNVHLSDCMSSNTIQFKSL